MPEDWRTLVDADLFKVDSSKVPEVSMAQASFAWSPDSLQHACLPHMLPVLEATFWTTSGNVCGLKALSQYTCAAAKRSSDLYCPLLNQQHHHLINSRQVDHHQQSDCTA